MTSKTTYRLLKINLDLMSNSFHPKFTTNCKSTTTKRNMEDAPPPAEGGEGRGRGGFGRGGRGRGRGRGGRGGRGRREEGEVWTPVTKLGRLVKEGKIGSIEEIFLFSLPVKEAEIIDYFLKDKLEDQGALIRPCYKYQTPYTNTAWCSHTA